MFDRIVGYENVKKELIDIREWFFKYLINVENPNNNIKLPRGILFHGAPGNGKTLFINEYSQSFGVTVINIKGDSSNITAEIHNAFLESKENEFSIILIDEIDQLIEKKECVERCIKEELDGVESTKNVLVLATTNSIHRLSDALLRSGRFDRVFEISSPDRESRKQLFSYYANILGIEGDIDFDYLSRINTGIRCADVCAILNDVLLRCGTKANTEEIEKSYKRIVEGYYDVGDIFDSSKARMEIAYHEIAHAVVANKYKDSFYFYKATFTPNFEGGLTTTWPTNENHVDIFTYYYDIEIALAGYVITQLKFHKLDAGCVIDLQQARKAAVMLVNKLGSSGPDAILPFYNNVERMESDVRKRKNERQIEKIIRKSLRNTKKYLKANMDKIDSLVNIMMKKGYIDRKDMDYVMNESLNPTQPNLVESKVKTKPVYASEVYK